MEIDHNEIVERVFSALLRVNGFYGDTSRVDAVIKSHSNAEWLRWLELFDEAAGERRPRDTNGDLILMSASLIQNRLNHLKKSIEYLIHEFESLPQPVRIRSITVNRNLVRTVDIEAGMSA